MFPRVLLLLNTLLAASVLAQVSETCPTYDFSKIKLVTFDVFACLMQWETSMIENVAEILPSLSSDEVHSVVIAWENSYGANQGRVFNEAETGADPFSWSISTALQVIVNDMGLNALVTREVFDQLVQAWGNLRPWDQTQETLEIIVKSGIKIGTLSNGDTKTLQRAVSIFNLPVSFSFTFPSDFPVGSFKPDVAMYDQVRNVGYAVEEIMHVGGGTTDAIGARDAGLFSSYNSVLHPTTTTYTARGLTGLHALNVSSTNQPCFTLNNITELPAVLGL